MWDIKIIDSNHKIKVKLIFHLNHVGYKANSKSGGDGEDKAFI